MPKPHNRSSLKRTYYRSFLLMVVVPLILVFVASEVVISYIIRSSSIQTIDEFQGNIATAVSGDVRNNALQLSHFVYANDGEFIQTAVRVSQSSGSDWYEADQAMQRAFRIATAPSQDILAGTFYMDGAGAVYMKNEVAIPEGRSVTPTGTSGRRSSPTRWCWAATTPAAPRWSGPSRTDRWSWSPLWPPTMPPTEAARWR